MANITGEVQPGTANDHRLLSGRDAADQHPESAITNLQVDLAARPSEVITDAEIMAL